MLRRGENFGNQGWPKAEKMRRRRENFGNQRWPKSGEELKKCAAGAKFLEIRGDQKLKKMRRRRENFGNQRWLKSGEELKKCAAGAKMLEILENSASRPCLVKNIGLNRRKQTNVYQRSFWFCDDAIVNGDHWGHGKSQCYKAMHHDTIYPDFIYCRQLLSILLFFWKLTKISGYGSSCPERYRAQKLIGEKCYFAVALLEMKNQSVLIAPGSQCLGCEKYQETIT